MLGIAYSTYAVVLWGSIPYMVEARTLGTAFGICTVFQNFATVIAPPILGIIQTNTSDIGYGYTWVEAFFIGVSFLAVVFNFGVYLCDRSQRQNILQSKEPLQNFERYTQLRITIRETRLRG